MKSYATKQEANLNIVTLHLQVESAKLFLEKLWELTQIGQTNSFLGQITKQKGKTMNAPVVVASATKGLSFAKKMMLPLLNAVGKKHEFRITVTSPDYKRVSILWGLIEIEEGEKREFIIRGTEAYVREVAGILVSNGFNVDKQLELPSDHRLIQHR